MLTLASSPTSIFFNSIILSLILVRYLLSIALCALLLTSFTFGAPIFGAGFKAILSPSRTTAGIPVKRVGPLLLVKKVCTGLFSIPDLTLVMMFCVVPA